MMTIIAATDYSPIAENAVTYAAEMAKYYHCRLLLFNAFKLSLHASNTILPASGIAALERSNEYHLQKEAARIAGAYSIQVDHVTSSTCVEDELKELIKMHEASLVVLGMAPESLHQELLGNTTTAAIGKMNFPVLAVPICAQFQGLKKILFASDRDDHTQSQQML
ncbi:MAG TPA: universal stress protein, partial [Pedobacter sp.]